MTIEERIAKLEDITGADLCSTGIAFPRQRIARLERLVEQMKDELATHERYGTNVVRQVLANNTARVSK